MPKKKISFPKEDIKWKDITKNFISQHNGHANLRTHKLTQAYQNMQVLEFLLE